MKDKIEQALQMYGPGKLSDLLVLYDLLVKSGIGIEDLREYLQDRNEAMKQQVEFEQEKITKLIQKHAICPDCGAQMQVIPAYGAIQTRFACTKCDLALDSKEPPSRWIHKFMEKEKEDVSGAVEEKQAGTAEPGGSEKTGPDGNSGKAESTKGKSS